MKGSWQPQQSTSLAAERVLGVRIVLGVLGVRALLGGASSVDAAVQNHIFAKTICSESSCSIGKNYLEGRHQLVA